MLAGSVMRSLYARAALDNFQQAEPSAADRADRARRLITDLKESSR
jgi:hypothetical protein